MEHRRNAVDEPENVPIPSVAPEYAMRALSGRGFATKAHPAAGGARDSLDGRRIPGRAQFMAQGADGRAKPRGPVLDYSLNPPTVPMDGRRNSAPPMFGKPVNTKVKGHSIAQGILFPPPETSVDIECGLILEDQVPPITDLRPYTMRPTAMLKKIKDDIEQGKRFPAQRRLVLHHQPPPYDAGPEALACLQSLDHIFFKKLTEIPDDMNVKIDIGQKAVVTHRGRILYLIGETQSSFSRYMLDRRFNSVMRDLNQDIAMSFIGHQRGNRGYIQVSVGPERTVVGTIEQDFCDSTYSIKDDEGRVVNRVQGPCYAVCVPCCFWCCNEHHQVSESDGVTDVGKVQCHWKKQPFSDADGLLGLSFPQDLPTWNKALLIGFLVLIHFQYYRRGGNGLIIAICSCILGLILLILIMKYLLGWF